MTETIIQPDNCNVHNNNMLIPNNITIHLLDNDFLLDDTLVEII